MAATRILQGNDLIGYCEGSNIYNHIGTYVGFADRATIKNSIGQAVGFYEMNGVVKDKLNRRVGFVESRGVILDNRNRFMGVVDYLDFRDSIWNGRYEPEEMARVSAIIVQAIYICGAGTLLILRPTRI